MTRTRAHATAEAVQLIAELKSTHAREMQEARVAATRLGVSLREAESRTRQIESQLALKAGAAAHRSDEADFYKRKVWLAPLNAWMQSVCRKPHPPTDCDPTGGGHASDGEVHRPPGATRAGARGEGAAGPRRCTARSAVASRLPTLRFRWLEA